MRVDPWARLRPNPPSPRGSQALRPKDRLRDPRLAHPSSWGSSSPHYFYWWRSHGLNTDFLELSVVTNAKKEKHALCLRNILKVQPLARTRNTALSTLSFVPFESQTSRVRIQETFSRQRKLVFSHLHETFLMIYRLVLIALAAIVIGDCAFSFGKIVKNTNVPFDVYRLQCLGLLPPPRKRTEIKSRV